MKYLVAICVLLLSLAGQAVGGDGKYLNVALLTLPERYLADIPLARRTALLTHLSEWDFDADRLDYDNGWLHWFYDGPPQDSPGGTSTFWVKLLPRSDGPTLVFVHMPKPFAAGGRPG